EIPPDGIWVDLGGGTGSNLEHLGSRIRDLKHVYIVDLSPSLLAVARERVAANGWTNVDVVQADALDFQLADDVDIVTFSYSLTMIPDWFTAIEHARTMLRPGGQIGVVDFYHSRKFPADGMKKHSWLTRTFWSLLVSRDNVFLSPDHLPFLQGRFETIYLREDMAKVPYVLWMRIPFYIFVGRLRGNDASATQQDT
ncbi:MAG: class I SAM-dependent methyltransferase, partial [Planctomycetales bacterium]|nr:class I SAM-dependent methyltransferase [Planctomycetales bacterium]